MGDDGGAATGLRRRVGLEIGSGKEGKLGKVIRKQGQAEMASVFTRHRS